MNEVIFTVAEKEAKELLEEILGGNNG